MTFDPLSIAGAVIGALIIGLLIWRLVRRKPSPEEIERRRRAAIHAHGKLGDGDVIEVEGVAVLYSYSVRGVGYTASQDVSVFESTLPENTVELIGPVLVKFDPRNPANSIVICEEWNGLTGRSRS